MLNDGEFGMFFDLNSAAIAKELNILEGDEEKITRFRNKVEQGLTDKYNWDIIACKISEPNKFFIDFFSCAL